MAARDADTDLREALDRDIRELIDGGALVEIFARYVPHAAPARRPSAGGS